MTEKELIERSEKHFDAVKKKDLAKILGFYEQTEELLVFVEGPRWRPLG